VYCSAYTKLLTVMFIQIVGERECSNLTDNIVLTSLRISRGFKLTGGLDENLIYYIYETKCKNDVC